jgi:hypothetical protein
MDRRTLVKWSGGATDAMMSKVARLADATHQSSANLRAGLSSAPALGYDLNAVGLERTHRISLDGEWHFKEDAKDIGEQQGWYHPGSITGRVGLVPLPWQLAFPDLFLYAGTGWYEKTLVIPADYAGRRTALASYGISDDAKLWINGHKAGEHRCGQAPFILDITALVRPGTDNTITIKAHSPGSISGLWQSLWLEATGKTYLADIFMVPDVDRSRAESRITVLSSEPSPKERRLSLNLVVRGSDDRQIAAARQVELAGGSVGAGAIIPVELKDAQLWELDAPRLYHVQAILSENGKVLDQASVDFGLRKIETRGDRFYLNNKAIYVVGGGLDPGGYGGAVDVNWHEPPPYHPQTDGEFRQVIELAKAMGINWGRVPLRPAPPRLLHWADRLGLLIWQGAPWAGPNNAVDIGTLPREEILQRWGALILRDRNHPSLVTWELVNEGVGSRTAMAELCPFVKGMDETRLVVDSAGGWAITELNYVDNHLPQSDLDDWHYYPEFDVFEDVRELLAIRSHGRPVTIGEFGPIPYICNADKIKERWGGQSAWFLEAHNAMWADGKYEERFYGWHLDKIYGNFKAFTEASDWYYFEGLKQQTDLMRINGDISGFVAWFSDTSFHPVGLVDYFRDKKVFCDELSKIWTQTAIVVDIPTRRNFWAGESVRADVYLSHFGDNDLLQGSIRWSLEDSPLQGTIKGFSVPEAEARHVGRIEFRAPAFNESKSVRLKVELQRKGATVAQNYVQLQVFPLSYRLPAKKSIMLRGPIPWRFEALGYEVRRLGDQIIPSGVQKGQLDLKGIDLKVPLVTTKLDPIAEALLKEGGTVLWLVCADMLFTAAHLPLQSLDASVLPFLHQHGLELGKKSLAGHSDSFFIKKNQGLFERIPYHNPFSWVFEKVWPEHVILGLKPENQEDMLAGAYGNMIWSHALDMEGNWLPPSQVDATIMQCRYGKGRLIISTFEILEKKCVYDPVGTIMLNDLIRYAQSDFGPTLRLA